jgi:hypothetical protein
MRLLNSTTYQMKEFYGWSTPPYAILSHTWGDDEVSFQDMQHFDPGWRNWPRMRLELLGSERGREEVALLIMEQDQVEKKTGFSKIRRCREQAKLNGIDWVWIDTCCIDKSSSAELSEAINSMYAWYRSSKVCYVYLQDVPPLNPFFPEREFKETRWFKRGWCLQELIAPKNIEFYAANWTEIGTKWSLKNAITSITGVPYEVLEGTIRLSDYTTAHKMSWASERRTTRQEDEAYCLLGIFEIAMPLLYGEGRRAFYRLQQEIVKQQEDYSLLLWTDAHPKIEFAAGVLAQSPAQFPQKGLQTTSGGQLDYGAIKSIFHDRHGLEKVTQNLKGWHPFQMTTRGLHVYTLTQRSSTGNASRLRSGEHLLLWTACIYHECYVCIVVEQQHHYIYSGFSTYKRRADLGTVLLRASDFEKSKLTALYLNTDVEMDPFRVKVASTNKSYFQLILSTKCDEEIQYDKALPSISFDETEDSAAGQRLYCHDVELGGRLLLAFKIYQKSTKSNIGYFTIELGLYTPWSVNPTCNLTVDTDPHQPLDEFDELMKVKQSSVTRKWTGEGYEKIETEDPKNKEEEKVYTDRAIGQLSGGNVVYVAVKANFDKMVETDDRKTKPLGHTLHVTLLAESAGGGDDSQMRMGGEHLSTVGMIEATRQHYKDMVLGR